MNGYESPCGPPGDPTAREWAEALLLSQRMGEGSTGPPGGTGERLPDWPRVHPEQPPAEPPDRRTPEPEPADADRPEPDDPGPPEPSVWAGPTGGPARGRPDPAVRTGTAVPLPDHPGLRDTLALARALRPLNRRRPDPRRRVLDEEATAVRTAELRHWAPVLETVHDGWLDVALVVEHSASMVLWRDVGRSFAELLRRQGAFRDVRVWRMDTWGSKEATLYSEQGTTAHDPAELLDPGGRRAVLVLSDGASDSWAGGSVPRMLLTWARHQPVAVLNPLPSRLWRDAPAAPVDVQLRAAAPGLPNARLGLRDGPPFPGGAAGGAPVPVPVLEIDPEWLSGWARLVSGDAPGWTPASVLLVDHDGLRTPWPSAEAEPAEPSTPAELVRRFRAGASPAAQHLAARLAMVPLTVRIMQAERASLLPSAGILPLAEIMLGGLLRETGPAPAPGDRRAEHGPLFEFIDGVRGHLIGGLGRTEIVRALPVVSAVAARVLGVRDDLAGLLLSTPDEVPGDALSSPERSLVGALPPALTALGTAYTAVAERARSMARADGPAGRTATPADPAEPTPDTALERTDAMDGATPHRTTPATPDPTTTDPAGPDRTGGSPPAAAGEPGRGRVPRPGPYFTGRESELRQLRAALADGVHAALLPQALYGLGGVGKTQLALEYMRRYAGDYDLVWCVPAEQPSVIRGSFSALAQHLGVQDADVQTEVSRVIEALEAGRPYKRWLLVFDNAGSPEEVQDFLPYMAGVEGGLGHVIVTSRDSGWADSVPALRVGVFPQAESVEFLRRRAPGLSAGEAERIAAALGDLPLALEQAAAMVVKSGLTGADYLDLLRTDGPRMRREETSTAPGTRPVSAVWQVSMRDLRERNPSAVELLRLLAFFGPDPVHLSFLHDARLLGFPEPLATLLRDRMARTRAITEIGRYSLLTVDAGTVQVHRVLRSVLQDELTEEEAAETRCRVHRTLAAHDPGDPQNSANWKGYEEILPHVRPSGMLESDDQEARWTVINVGRYLHARGDYRSAAELGEEIVRTWTARLGEDHLQTLIATRRLAAALWWTGAFERADELCGTTLERLRRTVGEDHEEYLATAGLKAAVLRVTGDFRGALELDRSVFERSVELFGRVDPTTTVAGHNYSVSLRMNGLFAEAHEIDRTNTEIYQRSQGPLSQQTLLSVNNVARDLRELGRFAESVDLQERTVARYREHYGDTHFDTLRAVKNLSVSCRKAGDRERGLALAREALASYRATRKEDEMDTLAAGANIANDLRLTGDAAGARQAGADALRAYRSALGPAHPFTLIAGINHGAALRAAGEVREAARLDEETVAGLAAALGDEHVWVQIARTNLATSLSLSGDPAAAVALGRQAARALEGLYGDSHPHTLAALRNLALDLEASGDLEASEDLLTTVRRRYRATLGDQHPETRNALSGLRAECDVEPPPI